VLEEWEGTAGAKMRQMGTLQGGGLRRGAKKGREEEACSKMRQTNGHAGGKKEEGGEGGRGGEGSKGVRGGGGGDALRFT
jgi:hypothetical protein